MDAEATVRGLAETLARQSFIIAAAERQLSDLIAERDRLQTVIGKIPAEILQPLMADLAPSNGHNK